MLHLTPSGLTSILMTTVLFRALAVHERPARSLVARFGLTEPVNLNRSQSAPSEDEQLSRGWLLCAARAVLDGAAPAPPPPHVWDRLPHDAEAEHLTPLVEIAVRQEPHGAPDRVR